MGPVSELDVYHGSPHRFPPTAKNPLGEFDASKIGTGEGAQAYGHGLYLAEAPGVANEYARKLAHQKSVDAVEDRGGLMIDGIFKPIKSFDGAYTSQEYRVLREIAENGPDAVLAKLKAHVDKVPVGHPMRAIRERVAAKTSEMVSKNRGRNISVVNDFYAPDIPPNLYKVDLPDEQIAKMLDWDKPLSQQPESVRASLAKVLRIEKGGQDDAEKWIAYLGDKSIDAANTRKALLEQIESTPAMFLIGKGTGRGGPEAKYVSETLKSLGIPGIKYLDQGSRVGGKGTSNFVVFPGGEKMLNILERQ